MYEIELVQEIGAPPGRVWDILTDFRAYDEWNPTITRMRATLTVGAPVSFVIAVGGREMKIAAEMIKVEPGIELRWRGPTSWLLSQVFRGEHYLRVEPDGSKASKLIHGERFGGASLPILWKKLQVDLDTAYGAMNRALKTRAESSAEGSRAANE